MTQESPPAKKRNLQVIALAVVCIVLAASLVGVGIIAFQPAKSSDQQATIDALNAQLAQFIANQTDIRPYVSQIANLQAQLQQYSDQNDTINELASDISSYQKHFAMQYVQTIYPQTTISQNPNTLTTLWSGTTQYFGYAVVQVNATATSTYAQVQYTFGGTPLTFNQTIGTTGTAILPVLPSTDDSSFIISIGNTQTSITNNTVTATVNFYY